MLTLPNYKIGSQIYESVNSLVYRGHRKKDNQPVILKVLKQDYPTPLEITRYQQEYEITHDFDLAGVINAYGIEKCQNTLVIILEDFGGESLKQLMADRPLALKEFLPLAIQIADSLGNIHAANIIHKDINPSNIVVNIDTNQLKIIDFGIASRLPRENTTLKNPEQLEGTLAYLSPEQTGRINRSMDYRTDLYSLGVTCYEMLTGKLPFDATDAMELVHCHLAKTSTPVCEVNPDVPPIVSDIVLKLLAKNAEDRYQSAFGVKADLEKCLALSKKLFGNKLSSTHFELAQNDFSGKLQIPQKLYGRENEVNTLLQAFERVSQDTAEMMLVAGYSGVGKTALVHEVHKPMTEKRGYFAAGKFDQFQKNIPYSAITQAFNEFFRYLLMENAENLANWQTKILDAVGNNGQIIIDVIPDLELVIGPQPAVAEVGSTEAQNRFQIFFLNFVKALCDKEHPFILFIDDLQWVDSASLSLLKSIMLDNEIQHLLIIVALRDNEVDSIHPFIMAVSELQKANTIINTIELANLQLEDVNQLLQDSLKCEAVQTQSLTGLIYQKTQGNAFFTHQFLQMLYFEALLWFDFEQHQWHWDVEQIAAQNITANVVELMANKIEKLPFSTSAALQLAACIGNQFDLSILAIIYEQDQNETLSALHPAITKELIQPLDENYKHLETAEKSQFKFLHDRVQQAADALIDDEQKQTVHLQIGRLLLKNTLAAALEEKIFDIVGHFNHSLELVKEPSERNQIAQLNLLAGQKAKMATAYNAAAKYLQIGQQCLSQNSWQTQYDFTLALYVEIATTAYLNGDFELMNQLAQVALQHAKNELDKIRIYEIKIQAGIAQGQLLEAIQIALTTLKLLGIHFPNKPNALDIYWLRKRTQFAIGRRKVEDLVKLEEMTDPVKRAIMRILMSVHTAIYFSAPELIFFETCTRVILSAQHGNTPESAHAYSDYGILLCRFMGKIELGYRFGQLGINLLERLNAKEIKAKTLVVFNIAIRYWKEHVKNTLTPLLEAYHSGLETGDLEYAAMATHVYCGHLYLLGDNLTEVAGKMAKHSAAIDQLNQKIAWQWNELFRQTVLNLRGETDNPLILKGEAYDEYQMLPIHQQNNDKTALCYLYFNKLINCYLFQKYSLAIEYYEITLNYLDSAVVMLLFPLCHFYGSLAKLALYPNVSKSEQQQIWKQIKINQKQMKNWAHHAPMNFQHKYDLVEAEKARALGQLEAIEWYEKAIVGARENEYINEEALAYELAGQFYLAKGKPKVAQVYLRDAHYAYQQWGALAKVKDLETRYSQFLSPKTTNAIPTNATISATRMASTSTTGSSESLDLNSVMKAAQTLSGEIVLSRLLEKMMHIVIENAGASIGFLLLPKQDSWFIEAQGQVDSDEVKVLQSFPIENQSLAETVIHYVIRTQENVVLNNASVEGQFIRDPYIVKQRPKSVLCAPLINQSQLCGLLYLENNLTTGAFTPKRIKVLNLLSSQIAISIENARLYTSITRFLPSEFLRLLNKKNIIEVQLGDQVEKEMSILFSDIRRFTSLSEKMTPQENFDFINSYLGRMEPIISQYQGFIDKYIGDAIMALFPTGADEAVKASIAMLKTLAAYNQERRQSGLEPIAIGIGLNTGLLMLGTVGGENRMDGTVISDAVNLASRIEGMTKMYGAALLISEETYNHLSDVSQYAIRTIDRVKVKGKSKPVTVYEVFDGDASHLVELKTKTRDDFENGLIHYRQKAFAKAIACFEQVLRINPNDKAAQIYRDRCQHWQKVGVPDDWAGVEALDRK